MTGLSRIMRTGEAQVRSTLTRGQVLCAARESTQISGSQNEGRGLVSEMTQTLTASQARQIAIATVRRAAVPEEVQLLNSMTRM
jgi:hypothetical protein